MANPLTRFAALFTLVFLVMAAPMPSPVSGQEASQQNAAATTTSQPELKSAEELEELVARIALYPDDLVALVMAGSLYPLQIVQAGRYLDQVKTKKDLKPNADWDGSVISLLNYPDIVSMMNDDLDWTQQLGEAVTNQQKDVLVAIQQLRDKAVASGAIKSDDKVTVKTENDNVVITPAKQEVTYVPQYDPAILLEPGYVVESPIVYGDPYPSYYYPYAPYWAGFWTGAVWGAAVDWDRWHTWGGDVDVDIDINDIDIDRDKFRFDRDNIANLDWNRDKGNLNFDRNQIRDDLRQRDGNRLDRKTDTGIRNARDTARRAGPEGGRDVRRDVQQGLKQRDGSPGIADRGQTDRARDGNRPQQRPSADRARAPDRARTPDRKPAAAQRKGPAKQAHASRPSPKPGARRDTRPRQPSAMGHYSRGRDAKMASHRGRVSHGGPRGGHRGGGGGGRRFHR